MDRMLRRIGRDMCALAFSGFLGRLMLLLPTEVGILGLADIGRVYLGGESSDKWHSGVGAGIWIAPIRRSNTFTLSLAQSEGRTAVHVRTGFLF